MRIVKLFFLIGSFLIYTTLSSANNISYAVNIGILHDTIPNGKNSESTKSISTNKEYSTGVFSGVNVDIGSFQRRLKKLSPRYTGYKIEVECSRVLLAPEDKLFQQFGNVSIPAQAPTSYFRYLFPDSASASVTIVPPG